MSEFFESVIKSVEFHGNIVLIKRVAEVQIKKGKNFVSICGIDAEAFPESINIYLPQKVILESIEFRKRKRIFEWEGDKDRIKRIEELKNKIKMYENKLQTLNSEYESLNKAIGRIYTMFSSNYLLKKVNEEKLSELSSLMYKRISEVSEEMISCENTIQKMKDELSILESELSAKRGVHDEGVVNLGLSSEVEGKYTIGLSYMIEPNLVSWSPIYELHLNEYSYFSFYVELQQNTSKPWKNVEILLSTKGFFPASKPIPHPWYISRERRRVMAAKEAIKEKREMLPEAAPLPYLSILKTAEIVKGEYVTFKLKEKIGLKPFSKKKVSIYSYKIEPKIYYVWDAFNSSDLVEVVKFKVDMPIVGGRCIIVKDGNYIGDTRLKYTPMGSFLEEGVSVEKDVELKKELESREESKKGIVKEKAFVKYAYKLSLKNRKDKRIRVIVYDRIPVAKDPEIDVILEESKPSPKELKMGILKWDFWMEPGEEKVIRFKFSVRYPPNMDLYLP
ncbi:MAG: DUF4139 domain-containing protein [Candidatus Asgardarchaeia archaeon]